MEMLKFLTLSCPTILDHKSPAADTLKSSKTLKPEACQLIKTQDSTHLSTAHLLLESRLLLDPSPPPSKADHLNLLLELILITLKLPLKRNKT